jgi:hypothetical protein
MKILTHLNLSQNELQNAVLHKLAVAPENPVVGQIYFNTEDKKAYIYQETGWENLGLSNELLAKLNGIEAGADKVLYGALPEAKAENAGKVVIYTGTATETHKPGLVYICTEKDGAYAWTEATPTMVGAETDSATVTVENGVISTAVRISGKEGNALAIDADGGLFIEATEVGSATEDEDGLMTSDQAAKLAGIEDGAQVNVLEGVQVNGVDLTIDEATKKVNLVNATATTAGLMSAEDKAALDAAVIKNSEQDTAIANLESKDTEIDGKIAGLEAKDTEIEGQISELATELRNKDTELAGKITNLEAKDVELASAITALQEEDGEVAGELAALKAKDEAIDGEIASLKAKDADLVKEDERLAGLIGDNADAIEGLGKSKQDKLTAGDHIEITEGNVVNVKLPTASADTAGVVKVGTGLKIEDGVLQSTFGGQADSVEWEGILNAPSTLGAKNGPVGTFAKVTVDEYGLVTAGAALEANDIPDLSATYVTTAREGKANGVATLDANAKINLEQIPDALLGNVKFGGTFDPETGVCTLVNGKIVDINGDEHTSLTIGSDNADEFTGYYFLATGSATLVGIDFLVGDWCISNGTAGWAKVDNTDAVMGVKGDKEDTYRIGQVNITAENVGAVKANDAIEGGIFVKVTVDEKGLVTGGEETLTLKDISDISSLNTAYVALNQGEANANKAVVTDAEGNVTTVARKYVQPVGDGSAKSYSIVHNMGTKDVIVQVSTADTYEIVYANIAIADENTITLNFANAPATDAYRVIVIA